MKTKNIIYLVVILLVIFVVFNIVAFGFFNNSEKDNNNNIITKQEYNPDINPEDFSTTIDNPYLTFTPRTKFTYEGETEEGTERNEVYVTEDTKTVMGIETVVVWDRVWLNGDLTEETYDWYAQDTEGNVWYFGEDSKEVVLGEIVSSEGSWESGVNGAKPGIVMEANPKIGDIYYQEYLKGEAEDQGEVISFDETVTVPYDTFEGCLKTRDFTPLEPDADEYKYYCTEIGNVVLEDSIEDEEQVKLISVETDAEPSPKEDIKLPGEEPAMSEERAIEIALEELPGRVTDVEIEVKYGKKVYAVEIVPEKDPERPYLIMSEKDVIIDFETGEVLGIES